MNAKLKYFILAVTLSCISCRGDEILLTGDIRVSELKNKTDYLAPVNLEKDSNKDININGAKIEFTQGVYAMEDAGFFEMTIGNSDTILFVLLDSERGSAEWGLKKWVPNKPVIQELYTEAIDIFHPINYWPGIEIPFVFKTANWSSEESVNLNCKTDVAGEFMIKNGIGSISTAVNSDHIQFSVATISYSQTLTKLNAIDMLLSGNIVDNLVINKNSLVHITDNLNISSTGSLSIGEGSIIIIDEGLNIINSGSINFLGTETNPILITCSESGKLFGGFISEGALATINATHSFFTNFSFHSAPEYQYGHAKHQALFKSKNTTLTFQNCYFMDSPGQVFYPENCNLEIENCIIQRTKTSGQINSSTLLIKDSYLSDFPDDSQNYRDDDNDAIYLNASNANIENSMFLYCKDDGIDSGGGDGGTININNCKIEACFHEGLALSSNVPVVKMHSIKNSILSNCQQAIELGYSSPNHRVTIDSCIITNNYVGVRYGDNYEWEVYGKLTLSNSEVKDNTRDIWNMVHQIWAAKNENFSIINTK